MSVISRWERKLRPTTSGPAVAGIPRRMSRARKILLATGASALAAGLALVVSLFPARFKTIWEASGSRLVASGSGFYVLSSGNVLSLWDSSGKVSDIGSSPTDVALGPDCLALVEPRVLRTVDLAHGAMAEPGWTAPVKTSERLLLCAAQGFVLTAWPADGLKYGEVWVLRAIGPGGSTLWEKPVPGIPQVATCSPTRILAGLVDLSSGGLPRLVALDRGSGQTVWEKALAPGLWRGIGFVSQGLAVAALDTGVSAFGADGSLLWIWDRRLPVLSVLVTSQAIYIATPGTPGIARMLSPYVVWAVSGAGSTLWSRPLRYRPLSLYPCSPQVSGATGAAAVVALSDSRVIGFSMETGEPLFAKRTGKRPIGFEAGCLLLQDSQGVRLVECKLPEPAGQTPTR